MANASIGAVRIIDASGDACDGDDGTLKVSVQAGDINIGNVDVVSSVHSSGMSTLTSYDQFDAPTTVGTLAASTATVTDCKEIIIQADHDNSGFVMVGSSGTSATSTLRGLKIHGGETLILSVASTANVYIDASASSQKLNVSIVK